MKMKRLAVMLLAGVLSAGTFALPVMAEPTEETVVEETVTEAPEENTEQEQTGAEVNGSVRETKEEEAPAEGRVTGDAAAEETSKETADPFSLTPKGNMTLVDDFSFEGGDKQFITLTTRDGNFYYLIIDRNKDGDENVHFLNQVDERDLINLMSDEDAAEARTALEEMKSKAEETVPDTASVSGDSTDTGRIQEKEPEEEKTITIGGMTISTKQLAAIIGTAVILVILIVAFIKLRNKKQPAQAKQMDPDDSYDDDYDDEMDFPEGDPEDESDM